MAIVYPLVILDIVISSLNVSHGVDLLLGTGVSKIDTYLLDTEYLCDVCGLPGAH